MVSKKIVKYAIPYRKKKFNKLNHQSENLKIQDKQKNPLTWNLHKKSTIKISSELWSRC